MVAPANLVAAYLVPPDATIIVQPPENLGAGSSRQSPPRDASRPIPPDEQFGAAVLPSGTRRCCVRSEQNLTHLHQVLKLKNLERFHLLPPATLALGMLALGKSLQLIVPRIPTSAFQMLIWDFFVT